MNKKIFIIGLGSKGIAGMVKYIPNPNQTATKSNIIDGNTWVDIKEHIDSVYSNSDNGTTDIFLNTRSGSLLPFIDDIRSAYTYYNIILMNDKDKWISRVDTAPWSDEISQSVIDDIQIYLASNEHTLVEIDNRLLASIGDDGIPAESLDYSVDKIERTIKYAVLTG